MRSLGAEYVFDQKDPKIVKEILKVMKTGDYITDFIGSIETQIACGTILGKIGGGKLPILKPPQGPFPESVEANFGMWIAIVEIMPLLTSFQYSL